MLFRSVVAAVIARNAEAFKGEVLAEELTAEAGKGYIKEWGINGEDMTFSVERV